MENESASVLAAPGLAAAAYSPDARPFRLPPQPAGGGATDATAAELSALRARLESGSPTVLVGAEGAARSRLAIEYANKFADAYPEGVVWLAADQDLPAQLSRLAVEARWVANETEPRVKLEVATHRLRSRSGCLILLDSVVDPAVLAPLAPLPGATPHFLATSDREIPGYTPFPVAPSETSAGPAPELPSDPSLREIADLLAWSAPAAMGRPLLAALLDRPEAEIAALDLSALATEPAVGDASRVALSRRLAARLRAAQPLADRRPWAEGVIARLGDWFEARRRKVEDFPEFAAEVDHLRAWREQAEALQSPGASRLLWLWAYPAYHFGQAQEAYDRVEHAFTVYRSEGRQDAALEAWLWNDLGVASASVGRLDEAREAHEKALELRTRELGAEAAETATSLAHLSALHAAEKEPDEAVALLERALAIQRKALGDQDAETAMSLTQLASLHGERGDWSTALELQAEAYEIQSFTLGEQSTETAKTLNNLAGIYGELGNWQQALKSQEQALRIFRETVGDEHPLTARLFNNMANSFANMGSWKEALRLQGLALAIVKKAFGDEHPDTVGAVLDTAVSLISLQRQFEARRLIDPYLRNPPAEGELREQLKMVEHELRKRLPGFRQPSSKPKAKKKKRR
ncbi:MAG TPA: tetratricopeptide repeat protein [Thermoanaerobaculia bacterium]|nr:tetratricopeptide repeat protein [Thermoanaerobaculia bacterium]